MIASSAGDTADGGQIRRDCLRRYHKGRPILGVITEIKPREKTRNAESQGALVKRRGLAQKTPHMTASMSINQLFGSMQKQLGAPATF
jgi:hypothetical protein